MGGGNEIRARAKKMSQDKVLIPHWKKMDRIPGFGSELGSGQRSDWMAKVCTNSVRTRIRIWKRDTIRYKTEDKFKS